MPEDKTIEKAIEQCDSQPASKLLGMKVIEATPGYGKVHMKMKPEFLNFNGTIFGGILAALADEAFAICVLSLAGQAAGAELSMHYLNAAMKEDELIAEGKVIKNGKRLGFAEMTITNQAGTIIAKAIGTYVRMAKKE
jgi:acyl-CoA thioesterase